MEKRPLGKTGVSVTVLGLGGEGVLRTYGYEGEAIALINRALDLGINYCESARAYAGSESYFGRALGARRKEVFLASKSHGRTKREALAHLQQSLLNLKTDYLDLWQIHDVRTDSEARGIFGPDGAYGAFREAREKGLVRFIGITGHRDPSLLRRCIEEYEFDTVLIPVNPAEPAYKDFISQVVPAARARDMGVIGMKVYLRGLAGRLPEIAGLETFMRFALSQEITNVVIGCDDAYQVEENARFARAFSPMPHEEQEALAKKIAPLARRLMYYKAEGLG